MANLQLRQVTLITKQENTRIVAESFCCALMQEAWGKRESWGERESWVTKPIKVCPFCAQKVIWLEPTDQEILQVSAK